MRVLGFTKKWTKLNADSFTTFRFPRKDADWTVGETVQLVYHPRSNIDREVIGQARIILKEPYLLKPTVIYHYPSEDDAEADGFECLDEMLDWFYDTYGEQIFTRSINKLTLEKI